MSDTQLQISEVAEKVVQFIGQQKGHFQELNQGCLNQLDFARECEFAKQHLMKNDYLLDTARLNPDSLHDAISNVAAIGISLNPALAYAYLVPRKVNKKQAVCLDISYRGLIKLATDTGNVKAMKAELVYTNDKFEYHGFHKEPVFAANPFGDRGELIGVYAMALMIDGTVLVETMTIDEVNKIRDDSEAYKSAAKEGGWKRDNNVWVKFYTEMVKKTVIKRAHKTLPPSKGTEIMGKAIEVINQHEGIEFDEPEELSFYTDEEMQEYQRCIDEGDYFNLFPLIRSLGAEAQLSLQNLCLPKAERGKKGKQTEDFKANLTEAERKVEAAIDLVREFCDSGDTPGLDETMGECSEWTRNYIMVRLTPEQRAIVATS